MATPSVNPWRRAKATAMQATAFGLPPVHPARQFWKALEQEAQEQEAREQKARTPGLGRRLGAVKYRQVHQKTELAPARNDSPRSYQPIGEEEEEEEEDTPTTGGRRRRRKHRSTKKNKSKHKKRTRTRRTHKKRH